MVVAINVMVKRFSPPAYPTRNQKTKASNSAAVCACHLLVKNCKP